MKRTGGVVNGLTFNPQLTVKLSVFSRLQSLINQSSGSFKQTKQPRNQLGTIAAVVFLQGLILKLEVRGLFRLSRIVPLFGHLPRSQIDLNGSTSDSPCWQQLSPNQRMKIETHRG
jgi:hypothetical protein